MEFLLRTHIYIISTSHRTFVYHGNIFDFKNHCLHRMFYSRQMKILRDSIQLQLYRNNFPLIYFPFNWSQNDNKLRNNLQHTLCIFGTLIKDKLRIRGGKAKKGKKTLSNIRRNVILGKVFDKIRLVCVCRSEHVLNFLSFFKNSGKVLRFMVLANKILKGKVG